MEPGTLKQLIGISLRYEDKLWHFRLYQWLLERNQRSEILEISSPYVQDFLKCAQATVPDSDELLWQFLEKQGQFERAAEELIRQAEKPGLELSKRIEKLTIAKGVVLQRLESSSKGATAQNVQQLLDIAILQMRVLHALQNVQTIEANSAASTLMHEGILDISTLYNRYIQKFGLLECSLAAFRCSNHTNFEDIRAVWDLIIRKDYIPGGDNNALK